MADTEILLEVKNLCKYFPAATNFFGKPIKFLKAVDNVSFKLQKGKTLGIVGESGCGKTTMGRTILRLYDVTSGEIWFKGREVSKIKNREFNKLRPNMQMIFQDPYASLSPRLTVGEIIGEAVKQHKIVSKSEYHDYVMGVMKLCGLQPHYFERYPHEFSGGQRQRICIARALALKPDLVICDEPVSALDVSIQAQIINMLIELRKSLGLTYVFISHDLSVVKHISDEVGVMYLGTMVEYGSKESIFNNTLHPYTKALFSAVPVPNPHVKMNRIILQGDIPSPVNPPSGCKFHTRCEKCMDICGRIAPLYKEVEEGHFCACHLYNTPEEEKQLEENYKEQLRLAEELKNKGKKVTVETNVPAPSAEQTVTVEEQKTAETVAQTSVESSPEIAQISREATVIEQKAEGIETQPAVDSAETIPAKEEVSPAEQAVPEEIKPVSEEKAAEEVKPVVAKPAVKKTTATKTTTKIGTAKTASKSTATKTTATRTASTKSGAAKTTAAKTTATRTASSKSTAAKTTTAKKAATEVNNVPKE